MSHTIKPNELRIGNVLMYTGADEGDLRCKIDAEEIVYCERNVDAFNKIHRPVLLTPEILLEMGARKAQEWTGYYIGSELIMFDDNGAYHYAMRTRLPYVHTLQNFIFAVRSEELTLNTK